MLSAENCPETVTLVLPEPHEKQGVFYTWPEIYPKAQVLVAPCGTKFGKAISVDTPISTPKGWKKMGDLVEGDFVFDENGKPTKIIEAFDVMYGRECYEVIFSDGEKIIADGDHEWVTQTYYERKNEARNIASDLHKGKCRTTKQILDTLVLRAGGFDRLNHSIPLVSNALEYGHKKLDIPPYTLGIWLGDGHKNTGVITNPDEDVFKEISKDGFGLSKQKSNKYSWRVCGLTKKLDALGFLNNKHIPLDYLHSSKEQRLSLLQGLLDSDGTIAKGGDICFDNTNKSLADGVSELAISLGIKVTRSKRFGKIAGIIYKLCYRVRFSTDITVFRINRKKERLSKTVSSKVKRRIIKDVKKISSVPVRCISVDNPTQLFLAGKGCIPTHNSYGCALWLLKEALQNRGYFCVWLAPTYLKAKIGYRYIKAMANIGDFVECLDGLLEVRFCNGSFIKFLHGKDAETTVEGEAVDRFVIDEGGKTSKQVWYSTFTTITQTMGKGIVTGTPRGFTWYYEVFRQAKRGDPFYCYAHLKTSDSPYVSEKAIEQAKRLLPKPLYDQYYNAVFVSSGSVFGDLTNIWREELGTFEGATKFWVHPDKKQREIDTIHGIDLAKMQDYTVYFSVNIEGNLTGYCRFRHSPYTTQIQRAKEYLERFYAKADNHIRFDATGVGVAVGDMFSEADIDASITPVTFTNKSKQEMITRMTVAVEQGWFRAPRIEQMEHEFASYELSVTRSGLYSYSAPDGEHDDIVSAGMLAISSAYQSSMADEAERMLEQTLDGTLENKEDQMSEWADAAMGKQEEDEFFDEGESEDFSFDMENA